MRRFSFLATAIVAFGVASTEAAQISLFTFDNAANRYQNTGGGPDGAPVTSHAPLNPGYTAPQFTTGVIGQAVTVRGQTADPMMAIDTTANAMPHYAATNQFGFWSGTIGLWFKTTTTGKYVTFVSNSSGSPATGAGSTPWKDPTAVYFYGDTGAWRTGNLEFEIVTGYYANGQDAPNHKFDFDNLVDAAAGTGWMDGAWHHIAATWDMPIGGGVADGKMYLDGQEIARRIDYNEIRSGDTFKPMERGALGTDSEVDNTTRELMFVGSGAVTMDEVATFNSSLKATQIKAIYDLSKTGVLGVKHGAADAQSMFDFYATAASGAIQSIGGQNWKKIGSGSAFDGTGAVSGDFLALGAGGGGLQSVAAVPEPSSCALLSAAGLGLLWFARRRSKNRIFQRRVA